MSTQCETPSLPNGDHRQAACEDPSHGEDDRGDVDAGERCVHAWPHHPGSDRRTECLAPLQQPVDHPLPELQLRRDAPPCEQLPGRFFGCCPRAALAAFCAGVWSPRDRRADSWRPSRATHTDHRERAREGVLVRAAR
jgi:hypothetical protein